MNEQTIKKLSAAWESSDRADILIWLADNAGEITPEQRGLIDAARSAACAELDRYSLRKDGIDAYNAAADRENKTYADKVRTILSNPFLSP